ncbi:MAG: hypothetical protein H6656_17130 [Ardenticatenaceae bacterium]|nr:hypothetical protein [Ardenticatenaceae bacterium]
MRHPNFLIRAVVNMLIGIAFGALSIGLFAFLVAGKEGFVNGLVWGAVLGIFGGLASLSMADSLVYWTGFFKRFGDDHYEEQSGGKNED